MTTQAIETTATPALSLNLEEGVAAHRMGDGLVAVDQVDGTTKALQRVVLTRENLEALLAWV